MSAYVIRPFRSDEVASVAAWEYEAPYEIYNGDPSHPEDYLVVDEDGFGYYAVVSTDDQTVVAFCCFGKEARVKGQREDPGTVDIGMGVRPDLVSQGLATEVLPLLMDFVRERFAPNRFRTAVASFNERSARLCLSSGFEIVRTFDDPGREFLELIRPA